MKYPPASTDNHSQLVAHIQSARAALRTITEASKRNAILDELRAATNKLWELIMRRGLAADSYRHYRRASSVRLRS